MLNWIGKLFGDRTAVEAQRSNPALKAAVAESAQIYSALPLSALIDEARRAELARTIYLEINTICNALDPVSACREALAMTMLRFAPLQVVMVPPRPAPDPFGLRDRSGISGDLRSEIVRLCAVDDVLRSETFQETESGEFDDLVAVIERIYWETRWLMDTLNATRKALGDMPEGEDWYDDFLYASCVSCEHRLRWSLELPPALPGDDAKQQAEACSVFTDIVLSGSRDPLAEWRDYVASLGVAPAARHA